MAKKKSKIQKARTRAAQKRGERKSRAARSDKVGLRPGGDHAGFDLFADAQLPGFDGFDDEGFDEFSPTLDDDLLEPIGLDFPFQLVPDHRRRSPHTVNASYTLRIELLGADPPIWRRVEVDANAPLAVVHVIIQTAMGWMDVEPHEIRHSRDPRDKLAERFAVYSHPSTITFLGYGSIPPEPAEEVTLVELLTAVDDALLYRYSFTDDWWHLVTLEKSEPYGAGSEQAPVRFVDGERAAPPDGAGGIDVYNRVVAGELPVPESYLDALLSRDPASEGFDPGHLDEDRCRGALESLAMLATRAAELQEPCDCPQCAGESEVSFSPTWRRQQRRAAEETITVRVDLLDATPPIWRRVELSSHLHLDDLHLALQIAMGWENAHLHHFVNAATRTDRFAERYVPTGLATEILPGEVPEHTVRLDELVSGKGDVFLYEYDFGDSWWHKIKVESVRPRADGDARVRVTGGRRACPPEDCGGIWLYNAYVAGELAPEDAQVVAEMHGGVDPSRFVAAVGDSAVRGAFGDPLDPGI